MDSLVPGVRALPQPERATTVGSVAEALHHIAGAMSDTQVMTVGERIVGWVGESAGAFAHEARHIQAAVRKTQGAIAGMVGALNEYQAVCDSLTQQITAHQQKWDANIAWYRREVSQLSSQAAASGGQFPLVDAVDSVEVVKAALRARLDECQADEARSYNRTVEAVDAAAASTAAKLKAAIDAVVPSGGGPGGARGVPSRAAVGLALFGGTKGILAAQSRWAAAQADAPAAAALIDRTDGKTGVPSQAALRQFNATYGARLASDPYFATMLMRHIGAEKLCYIGSRVAGGADLSDSHKALLKVFTANMGAGLILATGGSSTTDTGTTTGFKALDNALTVDGTKTVRQWRSDFQAALNTYGQTSYDYEGNVISARNGVKMSLFGYEVFGQYLGQGARAHPELSVGDHFLNGVDGKNSVAKAMVKWDAENPVNFRLNNVTTGSGYGGGKSEAPGMFKDGLSWDYLQNMYEAMDNAPDKAPVRTFMNSKLGWVNKWPNNEPGEPHYREMNMTRYLVGNRTQVGKVGSAALYWAEDKGEALGTLVEDISGDTSKLDSVDIAREFIKGYNDGLKRNYDGWQIGNQDKEKGQDVFGYKNSALRSHIGGILKEYVSDIVEEKKRFTGVKGGHGGSWDIRDGRYHLVFDSELSRIMHDEIITKDGKKEVKDVSKFFKDIAHDKKLIKEFSKHMVNNLTTDYYKAYTAYGDDRHKDILKNYVVENYSESLKVLKRAELMAGIDESESTVGKVMKFFKEVNDYGVSSIPVVGSSLQKVGNGVIQLCDDDRINKIAADHSLDGADVDIEVNNATDIVTSTQIKHQERIESPIVRKYENPKGSPSLQDVPGIKEYINMLPDNEQFFDKNGNEIPDGSLSKSQLQAKNRFIHSKWNGQGG